MNTTIARTIVTAIALLNSVLTMLGKNPIPWSDDEIYVAVSAVISVATTLWSWWKNNSFTPEAKAADVYMKELKSNK